MIKCLRTRNSFIKANGINKGKTGVTVEGRTVDPPTLHELTQSHCKETRNLGKGIFLRISHPSPLNETVIPVPSHGGVHGLLVKPGSLIQHQKCTWSIHNAHTCNTQEADTVVCVCASVCVSSGTGVLLSSPEADILHHSWVRLEFRTESYSRPLPAKSFRVHRMTGVFSRVRHLQTSELFTSVIHS